MLKTLAKHFRRFSNSYMLVAAAFLTLAGTVSYQQYMDLHGHSADWLMASVLHAAPSPSASAPSASAPSAYTRGELVIDLVKRMKQSRCFKDLCADMTGGMPEEKARCNLEKRGIYENKVGYKWYKGAASRAELIQGVVGAFKVPVTEDEDQPFKDVDSDAWYAPFIAAAYQENLIKDTRDHLFHPEENAGKKWAQRLIRKPALSGMCEGN